MKVGDQAPPPLIGKWVKGEPVKELEKGKVYVVEFWATWCGPCIAAFPHVTELQKKYADKGVTVIGVDIWERGDRSNVPEFVEKQGERMGYTVAVEQTDPANPARGQDGADVVTAGRGDGRPTAWVSTSNTSHGGLDCAPSGRNNRYPFSRLTGVTTMPDVMIKDALAGGPGVGQQVAVKGWVRTRRDSKAGFSFVQVNDGSCFDSIQAVCPNSLPNYASEVAKLTAGCSVIITGQLVQSQGKGQSYEIQASEVKVVGWVDDPETYPIQPKPHTMEYLREVAHLRPRTNTFGAVARVRNTLAMAVHRFFQDHGFFWIHTPIITSSDAEGAGAMFRVSTLDTANLPRTADGHVDYSKDFFGKPASLTVSGQLNVETYCLAMSKVYTFGPTFRAEQSFTPRHLAEFWMIEPEIAFADLRADADLAEAFLKYIFKAVLDERGDDMKFFVERIDKDAVNRLEKFVDSSFERMDYTDAIAALEKSGKKFEFPVKWGMDMQSEHERWLTEEHVKRPVVVMNYPKGIKAFYMRLNDDGKTVAAMDVLAPGIGEIIGGSQREERLDVLDRRMIESGLDPKAYWWYRDLRRYGTVPHAGFGLGFERTIIYATGMANIRDVIPFPRTPGHAEF